MGYTSIKTIETIEATTELEGRKIMYDITGEGPAVVFVHGVWATGGVWYPVIDELAQRFKCVNIHLPLGVHRYASPKNVDHSPAALARVVAGLLEKLDLRDVTLVGNDTGGAICQLVITKHPERIGRLVLTNCDAFEVFPPKKLAPLYFIARVPFLWKAFARRTLNPKTQRRFLATVQLTPPDMDNANMLMTRFATDDAIREDLRLTILQISPRITLDAAKGFAKFDRDVLILWGDQDIFFPVELGRRLENAFPRATMQVIPRSRLFVGIDQPHVVAKAIADFVPSN
jgi:pimeloyl-ACP methyl ester carboxylesterase